MKWNEAEQAVNDGAEARRRSWNPKQYVKAAHGDIFRFSRNDGSLTRDGRKRGTAGQRYNPDYYAQLADDWEII